MPFAIDLPRLRLGTYLLALVAVALLPAMLAGGLTAARLATAYRAEFEEGLRASAARLAMTMDKEIELHRAVLHLLAEATAERGAENPVPERQIRAAAQLLGATPTLVLPQAATAGDAPGQVLDLAVPLRPAADGATPWLGITLEPARLVRQIEAMPISDAGLVLLLDAQGRIAAGTPADHQAVGAVGPGWLHQAIAGRRQGLARGAFADGPDMILAFARLGQAPWTLAVAEPLRSYRAAWRAPLLRLGATGLLLAAVAGALAMLLSRNITRPIGRILRHAETIAAVGYDRPVAAPPPAGIAEVETLRRALLRAEDSLRHAAAAEREAARHQRLLAGELSHRVKNALAVVQAVAAATFRSTRSLTEFREVFDGRLQALARAHGLLLRNEWQAAGMAELVAEELTPFRRRGEGALTVQGPALRLPPRHGVSLGLILHELATNAAKHGAFAPGTEGRLRVSWWVEGQEAPPEEPRRLHLAWEESGTSPGALPEPGSGGMGQRLIRRLAGYDLGGSAHVERLADGLRWRLDLPLPGPEADGQVDGRADGPADPRPGTATTGPRRPPTAAADPAPASAG